MNEGVGLKKWVPKDSPCVTKAYLKPLAKPD